MDNTSTTQATAGRAERRSILGWAFYDWAESAFATSILVAVLPIYYLSIAPDGPIHLALGPWRVTTAASSLWAYTVSASTLIIAIPSPFLGAIADSGGSRKRFLAVFAYLGTKPFQEVHQLVGAIQQTVQPQLEVSNEAGAPASDAA